MILAGELHDGEHVLADYDPDGAAAELTLRVRPVHAPAAAATA